MTFKDMAPNEKQLILGILKHKIGEQKDCIAWLNANRGNRTISEWVNLCMGLANTRLQTVKAEEIKRIQEVQKVFEGAVVLDRPIDNY